MQLLGQLLDEARSQHLAVQAAAQAAAAQVKQADVSAAAAQLALRRALLGTTAAQGAVGAGSAGEGEGSATAEEEKEEERRLKLQLHEATLRSRMALQRLDNASAN